MTLDELIAELNSKNISVYLFAHVQPNGSVYWVCETAHPDRSRKIMNHFIPTIDHVKAFLAEVLREEKGARPSKLTKVMPQTATCEETSAPSLLDDLI